MSIDFYLEKNVATITINRPERMNAMDADHYSGLSQAWTRVRDDPDVRVAIITGAGDKAFSAGADLKSFISQESPLPELFLTQKGQLLNRGLELWKPVVAAVNGYCLAGGMTLFLATDLRVCAKHATFSLSEVKRGIFPANGGTQRVAQQLPHPIAMELLLLGDTIDADTALRWGLVNKVVEPGDLMSTAMDYALRLAANAPLAVQAAKELVIRSRDMDLATGLRLEQMMFRTLQGSLDAAEGLNAFAEKRQPRFKGC
ncbi:enoyl-CoA hydratase [Advenella sp. S44]|uniref:enoyl-CoA hydratase/isomerase family protein n=1 Tax=Advenella sp. S44 TaxID=1982755 RepID=UPI000C2A906B|nr:enoyl-CoA hydratase/isomerase family protein [Advenella sp. S44]PJX28345.1 enoyl-CoA hydratase [Advenella sp. S44]